MRKSLRRIFASFTVVAMLSVTAVCMAPETTTTESAENQVIHIHSHADAAANMVNWQCRNCGQRAWLRAGTQPAIGPCGGDWNKRHVWERM